MGIVTTDQIQYWLECDGAFVRVTENSAFDASNDLSTYSPTYKDRMNQTEYVTGRKTTIEMDIDLLSPGTLQEWLLDNEDEVNVETEVVRVFMFKEVMAGEPLAGTGTYRAKKAAFVLTQNPVDGAAGEAAKLTGTLTMTSDGWTPGVFDPETATFTPDAA